MNSRLAFLLTALLLLSALAPALPVSAAADKRSDKDWGYLNEEWRAGLGTGLGALNAIKLADIDNDGEVELLVGNSQGYLHILRWDDDTQGFTDLFQSVDLGGAIKALEVAQIDDDEALEIAIGYFWNSEIGKVRIFDGATLRSEQNWSLGDTFSADADFTEGWPYGLALGDLDGDDDYELAMGSHLGYLWVVDAVDPEGVGPSGNRDINEDEAEWLKELQYDFGGGEGQVEAQEHVWGLTMGNLDGDASLEVAVGTKQGWVGVFDGETAELQWAKDLDGSSSQDSHNWGLLAVDLDGNGIDDLVVAQQTRLTIFHDGDPDLGVHETSIRSGHGLAAADFFDDSDPELVVADSSGTIYIIQFDGSNIVIRQQWDSGYSMNAGAGVTAYEDRNWIASGGDLGVLTLWEVTSSTTHTEVWDSAPAEGDDSGLYSLPGGWAYGTAVGNIDDDPALELLVGSGSGRVYAFDSLNHTVDWVSPVLEKLPISVAVADTDGDGDPEIVIGTGTPGEDRVDSATGDGAEGYLYIFDDEGSGYTQAYRSGNIDQALGMTVLELDGSQYLEIGLVTSFTVVYSGSDPPDPVPHGKIRVFGYDGSTYDEEWSSSDQNQVVAGMAGGDVDDDASNEMVAGFRDGSVRVYRRSGGTYTAGTTINTGGADAFGLAVVDVDDDGDTEILVGTGKAGSKKAKLIFYNGATRAKEWESTRDDGSLWAVAGGDVDGDGETEFIFGTGGGELFVHDSDTHNTEGKTSALSGLTGHYGGIQIADLDNDGRAEIITGSESYLWVFATEGSAAYPDLAIYGARAPTNEIMLSPENPGEDDDIDVTITLHNVGGQTALGWRVGLYDGDPDSGGRKFTEITCQSGEGCENIILPGQNYTFTLTWYSGGPCSTRRAPGYHEIYAKAVHLRQGAESQEQRTSNNKDYRAITISEVEDETPVADGYLEKSVVWPGEPVWLFANDSYDNEDTDNLPDGDDGDTDLTYSFYPNSEGEWTSPISDPQWMFEFDSPDDNITVKVKAYDSRCQVSAEHELYLQVKANTQPEAVLAANRTSVNLGEFVTFDVSDSQDPDLRADLEYRFQFCNYQQTGKNACEGLPGEDQYRIDSDWVEEGATVKLYTDAEFNSQGYRISGVPLVDAEDQIRLFKLTGGRLLEIVDLTISSRGFNYTLPASVEESQNCYARLLVRELPDGSGDTELLTSAWSEAVMIQVVRPPNQAPVAVAVAGLLINEVPVFTIGTLQDATVGQTIYLSAEDSYDPDGEIVSYQWTIDGVPLPNGDRKAAEKVFNEPGSYRVTVKVTDDRGDTDTDTVTVVVGVAATIDDGNGFEIPLIHSLADAVGIDDWLMAVLLLVPLLIAGVIIAGRAGGSEEDEFEEDLDGPLVLACPTCGSSISVNSPQRPVQVGCPVCSSQFVLRE